MPGPPLKHRNTRNYNILLFFFFFSIDFRRVTRAFCRNPELTNRLRHITKGSHQKRPIRFVHVGGYTHTYSTIQTSSSDN